MPSDVKCGKRPRTEGRLCAVRRRTDSFGPDSAFASGNAVSRGTDDRAERRAGEQFTDAPGLVSLQDNGGPTQTMILVTGSVAIDAGSNPAPSTYDQRGPGFPRVSGFAVDIGAVEFHGERIFANRFEPGP